MLLVAEGLLLGFFRPTRAPVFGQHCESVGEGVFTEPATRENTFVLKGVVDFTRSILFHFTFDVTQPSTTATCHKFRSYLDYQSGYHVHRTGVAIGGLLGHGDS